MTERTAWTIESGEHQDKILQFYKERCHGADSNEAVTNASGVFCPAIWDNATCWPVTRAGELATQPCPAYVIGLDPQANASKQCMKEGQWYINPRLHRHWTNFSGCSSSPTATVIIDLYKVPNVTYIEDYLPSLKVIHQLGCSLSLVTLLIALIVLATNKRLRCPRNVVHMHLFLSFALRACVVLLKDSIYVNGIGLSFNVMKQNDDYFFKNHSTCKFVTSIWNYCVMANYSWILMEGLYLHNLIFLALFSDSSSITIYIILGWGMPALFLLSWVGLRIGLDNNNCWLIHEVPYISLIFEIPITMSVLINTAFFVNIVRVLLDKIKATFLEKPQTYRKWAKSTMVLVPLFGVHYIIFIGMKWIPVEHRNNSAEIVWLFCDQFFSSFQGFVVVMLYFFLNGEVKCELKKTWQGIWRNRPSGRKLSGFTKSSSVHGTYCTTASCASLNSMKCGNGRVGQPAQSISDKKISPFYPQLTGTNKSSNYGNLNAVNCEENDWNHPSGNNIELGSLIP